MIGRLFPLPLLLLAACGADEGERQGPIGFVGNVIFGTERPTVAVPAAAGVDITAPVVPDGSVLVPQLLEVQPEPALRGLIIRVTGAAPVQGYYGAALLPANRGEPDASGVLTFAFRAFAPEVPGAAGPLGTRRLMAATFVPDAVLDEITGFRIVAADDVVSLRR